MLSLMVENVNLNQPIINKRDISYSPSKTVLCVTGVAVHLEEITLKFLSLKIITLLTLLSGQSV